MLSRHWYCLLLLLNHPGVIQADEPATFAPPQAYPASRYEAGWSKNPFTLKTVAPIAAQDSFARDLAIGAHYGAADNPTIVVVNTKTNERILLRKDQPAPGGMRLKSVHLSSTRTECRAEVEQGAEAVELTYDLNYLAQVSASQTSRQAAAKPAAGTAKKATVRPPLPLPVTQARRRAVIHRPDPEVKPKPNSKCPLLLPLRRNAIGRTPPRRTIRRKKRRWCL
jgi:hypothetical protein